MLHRPGAHSLSHRRAVALGAALRLRLHLLFERFHSTATATLMTVSRGGGTALCVHTFLGDYDADREPKAPPAYLAHYTDLFRAAQVKGELFYVRNMRVDPVKLADSIGVVVDNVHAQMGGVPQAPDP